MEYESFLIDHFLYGDDSFTMKVNRLNSQNRCCHYVNLSDQFYLWCCIQHSGFVSFLKDTVASDCTDHIRLSIVALVY